MRLAKPTQSLQGLWLSAAILDWLPKELNAIRHGFAKSLETFCSIGSEILVADMQAAHLQMKVAEVGQCPS
jgi:hypothetical protein